MPEKNLHIVTHNVPWPADFGGVIDIFYKIKTLHEQGVKIHLHCFVYENNQPQHELNKYCEEVIYYKRKKNISRFSFRLPFIVNSRRSCDLIANLQKDEYPILLEGIHTTYYLHQGKLDNRKVIVRLFNTEFEYYRNLALHERNLLKKLYFSHESKLLKKYENGLAEKATIVAISEQDVNLYQQLFNATNIQYLPTFLPYVSAIGKEGKGCFCLYHANLSVNENEKAATWLLQTVFNGSKMPFIIAGKAPSQKLISLVNNHNHTCLLADPSGEEMQDLIAKAQVNVLPSFNNTGIKLKLINALFNGRHCIVNRAGVEGSGLEAVCHIAENENQFQSLVEKLYAQPFTEEDIKKRRAVLNEYYNNEVNAGKLIKMIWGE